MASRLLSYTDTGAPQLNNQPGSMVDLLKAVLVNGYGATSPLDWDMPFEDIASNSAVFRPKVGVRPFYRVLNNAEMDHYNMAQVYMYESMDTVSTGMFESPILNSTSAPCFCWNYTETQESLVIPWWIVGDDRGFYIMFKYRHNVTADTNGHHYVCRPHYMGEYTPLDYTSEKHACLIMHPFRGNNDYNYFYPRGAQGVDAENYQIMLRDHTKNSGYTIATMYQPNGGGYMGNIYPHASTFEGKTGISPLNGQYIGVTVFLQNSLGIIGTMPGMLAPMHRFPTTMLIEHVTMFPLKQNNGQDQSIIFYDKRYSSAWNTYNHSQLFMFIIGEGFRRGI